MNNNTNLESLYLHGRCKGLEEHLMVIKLLGELLMIEISTRKSAEQFIKTKGLIDEFEASLGV